MMMMMMLMLMLIVMMVMMMMMVLHLTGLLELVLSHELLEPLLLVQVLEYVRHVEEYPRRADHRHHEEDEQLQAIDHQRHILPIVTNLCMNEQT